MFDPKGCSHGVAWNEPCDKCENISLRQEVYSLSQDCKKVADELQKKPFMATQPEVIIDLYRTVDRLAMILLRIDY